MRECVKCIQEGLEEQWGINIFKKVVMRVENLVLVYGGEDKDWKLWTEELKKNVILEIGDVVLKGA